MEHWSTGSEAASVPLTNKVQELLILHSHILLQVIKWTHKEFCRPLNQNTENFWGFDLWRSPAAFISVDQFPPCVPGTNSNSKTLTERRVNRKAVALQYKIWKKSMGKRDESLIYISAKGFPPLFAGFCGYKVSWSGMCLIISVYPEVYRVPPALPCCGTCESSSFCLWTEKQNFPGFLNHQMMGKGCISQVFSWFGSPLWVGWVFTAPARTDLRTNHFLSAWQDHPRKNSSDQKTRFIAC